MLSCSTKNIVKDEVPQLTIAIASLAALLATLLIPSTTSPSVALIILLPINLAFSILALIVDIQTHTAKKTRLPNEYDGTVFTQYVHLQNVEKSLRMPAHVTLLVFASSTSLLVLIVVRLIAGSDHFQCHPPSLNFGPKNGEADGTDNISFTNEWETYGHFLQGFLASFLSVPAVVSGIAHFLSCCGTRALCCLRRGGDESEMDGSRSHKWVVLFLYITAAVMTIYPVYNFAKRVAYHAETFATSSFMNNGMEWAVGFVTGVSAGMLVVSKARSVLVTEEIMLVSGDYRAELLRADDLTISGRVEDYSYPRGVKVTAYWMRIFLGCLLTLSVIGSAFLMGLTWNLCEEGRDDCVNYVDGPVPIALVVGLVMIPVGINGVLFLEFCLCKQK